MKQRNINLDLIRGIAVLSVLSVHFFWNSAFYSTQLVGRKMYIAMLIRTACMICVPMFLILSGYLMNKKTFNRDYLLKGGLKRVLITYLLSTVLILVYRSYTTEYEISVMETILSLLKFEHYSWYIEMYVGLYLLIPFLNIIYWNISIKEKKALLIIFLLLSSVPILLLYEHNVVMPAFWQDLYPITYFYIGTFIFEYIEKTKTKAWMGLLLFILGVWAGGTFNYYHAYGKPFVWGIWCSWGNLFNVLATTGLFIFLLKIRIDGIPQIFKKLIILISKVSLPIYLLSYMTDDMLYPYLKQAIESFEGQFKYMPVMVMCSFGLAFLLAFVVDFISTMIMKGFEIVVKKIKVNWLS